MKKFILKTLLFFAICVVLDTCVGFASSTLQKSSKGGLTQKDEFIKNKMHADIVIMGSSRASHHYVSNLMADSLGCSVYNAGMDGKGIIMNYGVFLEITRRYTPKTIIYELTPDFDYLKGDNEQYLTHLRHSYDIKGVDSIFWNVNPNERIKMLSNSYRSNSLVPHLIYDNIVAQIDSLNGYVPLWNKVNKNEIKRRTIKKNSVDYPIDSLKVKYFQKMIALCQKKDIELIFAVSPLLIYMEDAYSFGFQLAASNNVKIIDAQQVMSDFKEELFQDDYHLNNDGATMYTLEVIRIIINENHNLL